MVIVCYIILKAIIQWAIIWIKLKMYQFVKYLQNYIWLSIALMNVLVDINKKSTLNGLVKFAIRMKCFVLPSEMHRFLNKKGSLF